ncbi:outer membrane beta-barrel family protein [Dokdonia sp. 4H-3-7-5]|uniref:outer membrane beta-barrel family protein n=1 Tax=Dokdonia sp. (strain 4H-3-7-5) TaxID=983548 RepID=UPI00020A72E8|nr:outer membrane beta-barrel family protein [Dokdonia sp. 4H-3-7-5]AEE18657.1 TonB-dependent receptor [Dokdonia sp. 4H-3-7-5]
MTEIKNSLILIFIVLTAFCSYGQDFNINGKVQDVNAQPIPFANVVLLDAEKEIVQGTITEDNGSFVISSIKPSEEYYIKVSFVGFEDVTTNVISLSGNRTLSPIVLQASEESLGEVTITAKTPTVDRKSDRLVFNVENSILSTGSTLDILRRTPAVVVTQGGINVRNQPVTVYLNDRKVQLSVEEIRSLLESLDGNNIKSVEVITNPPAKYDAEGGAILNINTSKAVAAGYKGNVSATGTYAIYPKHTFGTSHFFKNDKVSLFFNYSYNPLKATKQSDNSINYVDQGVTKIWDQDFERKTWSKAHNANLVVDYELTEKSQLSLSVIGLFSPDVFEFTRATTDVVSPSEDPFFIRTQSNIDSDRNNVAFDLKHTYALEKGELSTSAHFTSFNRSKLQRLGSVYTNEINDVLSNIRFATDATQDIEIFTGQVDYNRSFGEVLFQSGAKVAIIDSQSKIDFFDLNNVENTGLEQAQSDNFLYDENVYAAYISFNKDWEKWSIKGGLRAEQTNSIGNSIVLNTKTELDYFELFPSAYVQYSPFENHSFAIDYSRRLERPRYQDLNPFAYFINENNFIIGNSGLQPSFSHQFNVNYSLKDEYFFDVYYRDNGENIVRVATQDNENQVLRSDSQNALGSKSWGLDFSHGRSVSSWLYTSVYVSAFHEEDSFLINRSTNTSFKNDVNGFYAYVGNYLTLDKAETLTGFVTFEYLSKFIVGSYTQDETIQLDLGLRKSLWNKRASVSLSVGDILNQANAVVSAKYEGLDNQYFPELETQFLRIGFKYNFGNYKLKDNNRDLDKAERDRINN